MVRLPTTVNQRTVLV